MFFVLPFPAKFVVEEIEFDFFGGDSGKAEVTGDREGRTICGAKETDAAIEID